MRPLVGAAICGGLGLVQIGAAAAVSALIGKYLDGDFPLDDTGKHSVSCALYMRSASACTAGYVSTTASILLSLAMVALQCTTVEGRAGLGFCGPILSAVGFFWWAGYSASITSAASTAGKWEDELSAYRIAVVAISWCCAALFLLSFFVSAAAAAAASRARSRLAARPSLSRDSPNKRYNQPVASPPSSPAKSHKSCNSAYEPFESDSPKKWVQPHNRRSGHMPVTSDGLRTLLLVEGEPVPLSPNLSPAHSPKAAGRSPMHRGLSGAGGSGSVVGSFSKIVMPDGSQTL